MDELAGNTRTIYQELCQSYRAIDDFRMKLMGLLPLVTAGGIFILIADQTKLNIAQKFFLPIGAFGFLVAFGLFCYELYGVKKCHGLIQAGRRLEEGMHIENGQFRTRPPGLAGFINEPFASGVIYPAVLAAWVFVASVPGSLENAPRAPAIGIFAAGFVIALVWNLWLQFHGSEKRPESSETAGSSTEPQRSAGARLGVHGTGSGDNGGLARRT